jgi:hypothetical protein
MLSESTNDTSCNTSRKTIPNEVRYILDIFDNDIGQMLINYDLDNQESYDLLGGGYIELCDEQNNIKLKDKSDYSYSKVRDVKFKFKKIDKDKNECNIKDNYDIKNDSIGTYLYNKNYKFTKEFICKEIYQINKKIRLFKNKLLIILIKKEEKGKYKILILLIIEKEIKEDEDEGKYQENKYKYVFNNNIKLIKCSFSINIPQVGNNFFCYLLEKNKKQEIILIFLYEKKIYLFKKENINDELEPIQYIFEIDFEIKYICPIKIIKENKKKMLQRKDDVSCTDYFLAINDRNLKICNFIEEIGKLYFFNIEYEYESEEDKNAIEKKNLNDIEHLDDGLIAFYFKSEQKDETTYFYIYRKD